MDGQSFYDDLIGSGPNGELLAEIRENFDYCAQYWKEVREEGAKDMRLVGGDAWPKDEREARVNANRICLSLDEFSQYENQVINGVRHSKRAISVVPEGNGANDKSAEYRGGIIRGVEYKCKAPGSYIRALQNALERGYGYVKVSTDYESPESTNLVLKIIGVPNPDVIYLDPDAKKPDFSDGQLAFEFETMKERDFKAAWPNAEIRSFNPDLAKFAPGWILPGDTGYRVVVAKYWKVKSKKRKLVVLPNGEKVFMDEIPKAKLIPNKYDKGALVELPDGQQLVAIDWRNTKEQEVCQYITNGVEILEEEPWGGTTIPIVPCFGKELWMPAASGGSGSGDKRVLISLARMARVPCLLYSYARTSQAEICGQAAKNLYLGYEGQFDTSTPWDKINRVLTGYATVKGQTQESIAAGAGWLPLPQMNNFEPPIQALEMLAEGARRAIQSACGINGLLSGKRGQEQSAKSGVALQELEEQAAEGTFHFVDNYMLMIEQVGRICDEMLDIVYDTPRDVVSMGMDDKPSVLAVNKEGKDPKTGEVINFKLEGSGDHGVTIKAGKSFQSEREEVNELADMLAQNEFVFQRTADLIVKLKSQNPIALEIAERLAPPGTKDGEQQIPPEVQQQIAELQKELQAAHAFAQQQLEALKAKLPELENNVKLKQMDIDFQREKLGVESDVKLSIAGLQADLTTLQEEIKTLMQAESLRSAAGDRLSEEQQAERGRQHETEQAEATRLHESQQAERGHEQTLEQTEQAAALAPKPVVK